MTLSFKLLTALPLVFLTVGCVAGGTEADLTASEIRASEPDVDADEDGPRGI